MSDVTVLGVLIRDSIAVIKSHDPEASWEEKVYVANTSILLSIWKEVRTGT